MKIPDPYTLPPMDFVGGSTQDLIFHCYSEQNRKPQDMSSCAANFSIVNFVNKNGDPLINKQFDVVTTEEGSNVLSLTLDPADTADLPAGKYIYQITIKDITGDVEIPNQGIIHIIRNINREFVK